MNSSGFIRPTYYSEMVSQCVVDWARSSVGWLEIKGFAKMCDFSLTHNLRRRVQELVDLQILERTYKPNESGRWTLFYQPTTAYREVVRLPELPF